MHILVRVYLVSKVSWIDRITVGLSLVHGVHSALLLYPSLDPRSHGKHKQLGV